MKLSRLLPRSRPDADPLRRAHVLPKRERRLLHRIMRLLNDHQQPNLNTLTVAIRNIDLLALNTKALGYELARLMAEALPLPFETEAVTVGLGWKPSTQADMESAWVRHWLRELQIPFLYHRKLWELAYVLQVLHEAGHLKQHARGIGFGCGTEPMPSYFAARGMTVLATDLPSSDAFSAGWRATSQHAVALEDLFQPHLVDRPTFDERVSFREVDMNAIPDDLNGYDFCWSVCAMEHLGSIERGMSFVEASLATLRPGGTAVHTTEFNLNPKGPTIDNWPTVLFKRYHLDLLAQRLRAAGHKVASLDFDTGDRPLDRFIDLPPWHDGIWERVTGTIGQQAHLKVAIDGFVATCFGIAVTKRQS